MELPRRLRVCASATRRMLRAIDFRQRYGLLSVAIRRTQCGDTVFEVPLEFSGRLARENPRHRVG